MEVLRDDVWKSGDLVRTFLGGVRGGIPFAAEQLEVMLRVIEGAGRPVERLLDVGSGAGTVAAAVLTRYPEAAATLVDFSEPMMTAARERFPEERHRLVPADFGAPSWVAAVAPGAPYDAIVSGYAIHHQPDERKRGLYAELYDLLAPGGVFVNVEHVAPASPWVGRLSDELFVDTLTAFHERTGTGKTRAQVAEEFVYRPDKAANILAPVDLQCEWLREIGFVDVDCFFKVFELAVFGGRRPTEDGAG